MICIRARQVSITRMAIVTNNSIKLRIEPIFFTTVCWFQMIFTWVLDDSEYVTVFRPLIFLKSTLKNWFSTHFPWNNENRFFKCSLKKTVQTNVEIFGLKSNDKKLHRFIDSPEWWEWRKSERLSTAIYSLTVCQANHMYIWTPYWIHDK